MRQSIWISTSCDLEVKFIHSACKMLYTHPSNTFWLDSEYDPDKIREFFPDDNGLEKMIIFFEEVYKWKNRSMTDFYKQFQYDAQPFVGRSREYELNQNHLWACKKLYSLWWDLAPHKSYNPDKIMASLKGHYIQEMITIFQREYEWEKSTMGDFYLHFGMLYKQSTTIFITKNLWKFSSYVKDLLGSSRYTFNTRDIVSSILTMWIWSYIPFSNIYNNYSSSEYYQNNLKIYSSAINNISTIWESVVDIDFLTSLDIDEIDWFYRNTMMLIDGLQSIDPASQNMLSESKNILKQYTSLFDTAEVSIARRLRGTNISQEIDIITFIDQFWWQEKVLSVFKQALIDFYKLLIEQEAKKPNDNNENIKPLLFWRKEDETWNPQQDEISWP